MLNVAVPIVTSVNVSTAPTAPATSRSSQARVEEQPAGAVEEQEAEVAPPVAPGVQVGRTAAAVAVQVGRHLGHVRPLSVALTTISLANSMPGRLQVEGEDGVAAEGPQPAVEVAGCPMRKNSRPRKDRAGLPT